METLRLVDLCAGLGGFHYGAHLAEVGGPEPVRLECVLASELDDELRRLYVSNFRRADSNFEHVYSQYAPPDDCARTAGLEDLYLDGRLQKVHGRLETLLDPGLGKVRRWGPKTMLAGERLIPDHDILCAGFPCQPFSKSGFQRGFDDGEARRGTVWSLIWTVIKECWPSYLLLENVGNFERHDKGNTWRFIREQLEAQYHIVATTHVGSRDTWRGLLSPHHFGLPHHRERFFICAQHKKKVGPFTRDPFPKSFRWEDSHYHRRQGARLSSTRAAIALKEIVVEGQARVEMGELRSSYLSKRQVACVNHWQELLNHISRLSSVDKSRLGPLPSFPVWGFELDPWHHYPYEVLDSPPKVATTDELRKYRLRQIARSRTAGLAPPRSGENAVHFGGRSTVASWQSYWPNYASRNVWPRWKVSFLRQNREWGWQLVAAFRTFKNLTWYRDWLDRLYESPHSFQKLEWNCRGEELVLWKHILQFRPSGLRVKRFEHVPALVALTTTQVPIVPWLGNGRFLPFGARGRFLLPDEGSRLQGFPWEWGVPSARTTAFRALGNAVHAGLVRMVLTTWLGAEPAECFVGQTLLPVALEEASG